MATTTVESWLAGYREPRRAAALRAYLKNLDKPYRDAERQRLLSLTSQALPYRTSGLEPILLERRIRVTLKATLFLFSAPYVPGCTTSVQTSTSRSGITNWQVAIGVGGGSASTVQTALKATFIAHAGEHKRIFLPVPAVAVRRYVYRPGLSTARPATVRPLTTNFQHVQPLPAANPLAGVLDPGTPVPAVESVARPGQILSGLSTLPAARSALLTGRRLRPGRLIKSFYLKGDSSGRPATYELDFSQSGDFNVTAGGTLFGSTVRADALVRLTNRLALTFVFTGGHDYHLHRKLYQPGIEWTVS